MKIKKNENMYYFETLNFLHKTYFIFFAGLIFCFAGCKDTITNQQVNDVVIPSSNVSYAKYIQPVFTVKCSFSGCHDDGSKAGGVALTSWSGTTSGYTIVAPGSPETSKIVWAVQGLNGSSPMPKPPYPGLTENQLNGLKTWIKEGALNN